MAKKKTQDEKLSNMEVQELESLKEESAELVTFEEWYNLRQTIIPTIHRKEIILADFKGRKVPDEAPMEVFDDALGKYGVLL